MPSEWTEVNIGLDGDPVRLLVDLVDYLIHSVLAGQLDDWHYLWAVDPIAQPHLRLRVRWREPSRVTGDRRLAEFLDEEIGKAHIPDWFAGSHGVRDQVYRGEADEAGPELWELTYRDRTAGSELALAIIKQHDQGSLARPRDFHWQRRALGHANQLMLPADLRDIDDARIASMLPNLPRLINAPESG